MAAQSCREEKKKKEKGRDLVAFNGGCCWRYWECCCRWRAVHCGAVCIAERSRGAEKRADDIFQGIVDGLKKFDASGAFRGKLPRQEMLLLLWINDPSEQNAKSVMKWVGQVNPRPVSQWFNAVYPYRL